MQRRKRVLVVEDSPLNQDLLTQLLEDEYEVLVAVDGGEAIRKAEQEKPDLVLMDLGLPVLDGWEATRRIRRRAALRSIPIIAVTSHAMPDEERKAHEAGCDDYLAKPIDERVLRQKITLLLSRGR